MALTLVIGNKSFSSWSLRPWIALKAAKIPFEERLILLAQPGTQKELSALSPTGKVPVLIDGDLVIPESLAILEYAAELAPEAQLWPADRKARAFARAAATEMHAGFAHLRNHCPMNLRRHLKPRKNGLTPEVERDCARMTALWKECRTRFGAGGPYLFGAFTNADAMFAPAVTRFISYDLPRDKEAEAYCQAIYANTAFKEWQARAALETAGIPSTENIDDA
jgi:glutathione S-transferase